MLGPSQRVRVLSPFSQNIWVRGTRLKTQSFKPEKSPQSLAAGIMTIPCEDIVGYLSPNPGNPISKAAAR